MDIDDFVSFEVAKILKGIGYNKQCLAYYNTFGKFEWFRSVERCEEIIYISQGIDFYSRVEEICCYLAPSLIDVMKWLMEEKKIAINVKFIPNSVVLRFAYEIVDMKSKNRFEPIYSHLMLSWNNAANEAIERVVKNLI